LNRLAATEGDMFWEIVLGMLGAIVLLVLLTFLLGALQRAFQRLFARRVGAEGARPEMIRVYARFAAVAVIALAAVFALLLRFA
jgi:Trk-type K+ transport system membrane component